jgi:hypothetical protein
LPTEIQQLRLAIERSTLLGTRTQLAISQLQLQETAVARLTQQYNEVRSGSPAMTARRNQLAESMRDLEQKRMAPEFASPQQREVLEDQLKHIRFELEAATATEQQRAARESELAVQLQATQNQITDSRGRIAEMERALDVAIQQLLKQK